MKRFLATILATIMVLSLAAVPVGAKSPANAKGLTEQVEDGTILHTWCWSYKTVKENISEIAAAGFSAVQVSPISLCKVGGKNINGGWYWHYQPVNYEVFGNYQMGTLEDFQAMCDEAHRYGLKVIVDTVINHCTSDYSAIDPGITGGFDGQAFHDHSTHSHPKADWSEFDRYEETQYPLSGLYDWNTQRQDVQDYLKNFLKKCVEYGADGFRFDAAKLIELPDDTSAVYGDDFACDFWTEILENGASFQYGEALQEGGKHEYNQGADGKSGYDDSDTSRLGAYQSLSFTKPDGQTQKFFTTASYYGFRVRECISEGNLKADYIGDFLMPKGATVQQTVTWVESHDNYCNNASYNQINDQQVIQGWAVLAARAGGTPLFYSRPNNSSAANPWGDDVIGPVGSDLYKNPQVVALNYFGNEMGDDAPEYLSNPHGNTQALMIERGTKDFGGSVIINTADTDLVLDGVAVQAMADGVYTDQAYGGSFRVEKGKLYGTVKAGMVAVVYRSQIAQDNKTAFRPEVSLSASTQEFLSPTITVTVNLRGCSKGAYQIDGGAWVDCQNGTTLTFGENMSADDSVALNVVGYDGNGNQIAQTEAVYTKRVAHGQTIAYFDSRAYPQWDDLYVYAYSNSGNNGGWPGVKPEDMGNGIYRYVLPFALESASGLHIMWTNNGTKTDGVAELPMQPRTSMIYKADRTWAAYEGGTACVGLSHSGGNVKENFSVTITVVDCEDVTYVLGSGEPVACTHGTAVEIPVDKMAAGEGITLTVSGKDKDGKQYTAKATYTKLGEYGETKVYLDPSLYPDWKEPYAYFWANGVAEYAPWPGIAMTLEDGLYTCVLPDELAGCTMNVIFSNNGANQHPDVSSRPGTQMLLDGTGEWVSYTPPQKPTEPTETTPPTTEPTEPTEATPQPKENSPWIPVVIVVAILLIAGGITAVVVYKKKAK